MKWPNVYRLLLVIWPLVVVWLDGDHLDTNSYPIFENSLSDTLINAEVILPYGEEFETHKVKGCHKHCERGITWDI